MHANLGPADNVLTRLFLRADAELAQVVPNLTFLYHPEITPTERLQQAIENICVCGKPHIANAPLHDNIFTSGGYGIVSCDNALPLGGGTTLVRLNLKEVALHSQGEALADFIRTLGRVPVRLNAFHQHNVYGPAATRQSQPRPISNRWTERWRRAASAPRDT